MGAINPIAWRTSSSTTDRVAAKISRQSAHGHAMQGAEAIKRKLAEFYGQNDIGVDGFKCQHAEPCLTAAGEELYRGTEAYVGTGYGAPGRMRLAVLSLDMGYDDKRRFEERRKGIEDVDLSVHKNHMKRTLETVREIIGTRESDLPAFAMVNAAKCCRKTSSRMVPAKLYRNCRPFLIEEIEILRPDILYTQGVKAKEVAQQIPQQPRGEIDAAIAENSMVDDATAASVRSYLNIVGIANRPTVWLHSPHPCSWGRLWWTWRAQHLPVLAVVVRQLSASLNSDRAAMVSETGGS